MPNRPRFPSRPRLARTRLVVAGVVLALATAGGCATRDPADPADPADGGAKSGARSSGVPAGYPDSTNTGASGPLRRHDGHMLVNRDNAVIENLDIRGELRIYGDNARITNVRVESESDWVVLINGRGTVIEDSTFIGGDDSQASLAGTFVGRRLDLSGASDGVKMQAGGELYDSYIHDLCDKEGAHNDGIEAGKQVRLVHNTVLNPRSQTSAIMLSEYGSDPDTDVLVQDNLIGGGGYTFYGGAPDTARGHVVVGNLFTTRYYGNGGYYGAVAYWQPDGNTWSDNRWADGPQQGRLVRP